MREILFRGKTQQPCGEWVYGSLLTNYPCCKNEVDETVKEYHIIDGKARELKMVQVIPKTVGQYTGINLGNEKLFEGDIVECHEDYDDSWGYSQTSVVIAVVIWDEENFCWSFEVDKKYRQPCNDWTWDNSFINGNIHDNPELMEEG